MWERGRQERYQVVQLEAAVLSNILKVCLESKQVKRAATSGLGSYYCFTSST